MPATASALKAAVLGYELDASCFNPIVQFFNPVTPRATAANREVLYCFSS
jgi:putative hemolysin